MPKLLTNGQATPRDEMQEILAGITARTWEKGPSPDEKTIGSVGKDFDSIHAINAK
jgi:hypothetical protein